MKKEKVLYILTILLLLFQICIPAAKVAKAETILNSSEIEEENPTNVNPKTSQSNSVLDSSNFMDTNKTTNFKSAEAINDVSNKINVLDKKIFVNDTEYIFGNDITTGDKFRMDIFWEMLNTDGVKADDYFIIPLNIKGIDISTEAESPVLISNGESNVEIGTFVIMKDQDNNFFIKCTFNEKINDYNSLTNGKFYASGIADKGKIEIEMNDDQKVTIVVNDPETPIDPEITPFEPAELGKWGWQRGSDSTLTWQLGVNRKTFFDVLTGKITDISNLKSEQVVLVEELQNGQTFFDKNGLTIRVEWPLVVEEAGELKGADPAFSSSYLDSSTSMAQIEYNAGETAEQFKARVKNTLGPCYGVFPKSEHTAEAKANNAGDYLYLNMGNMVDSLVSKDTKSQLLETLSNTSYSDEVKKTTKEAYERYATVLGIEDNTPLPIMGLIILFTTEVPAGTITQDINNKAYTERGDTGEATLKYVDYGGIVSGIEKGTVRIIKTNKDTSQVLPDIEFSLYKVDSSSRQLIDKKNTNANGIIEFKNLSIGNFEIVESNSGNYSSTSLEVTDANNKTISTKDITINGLTYKGFELSITGVETEGLGFKATNKVQNTTIPFQANKILTGKNLTAGAFRFELKNQNNTVLQTKTNDATGAINFDEITYDKEGTYNYTISEVIGNQTGMTYDKHIVNVEVTVKDDNGKLIATTAYTGDQTFNNSYVLKKATNVTKNKKQFPRTGERNSNILLGTGFAILLLLYFLKKHKKEH